MQEVSYRIRLKGIDMLTQACCQLTINAFKFPPLQLNPSSASCLQHAEIATQAQVMEQLDGDWQLAYTCNSALNSVLALGRWGSWVAMLTYNDNAAVEGKSVSLACGLAAWRRCSA